MQHQVELNWWYSYVDNVCDDTFDLFIMNNWLDCSNLLQLTKTYLH